MFANSLILILSLAVSTQALATPHAGRSVHHRSVAARVASPVPQGINVNHVVPLKRSLERRCKTRPGSTSKAASSSATSAAASVPVANAGGDPTLVLSTSTAAGTTSTTHTRHTTSSTEAAPTSTTSTKAAPTTTKAATTPTTTKAAAPTTTKASSGNSNLPSFMTGTQTGQGTYYGTGLGACGITNSDTDYIAAVSHLLFDTYPGYAGGNPNNNPMCGKKVKATFEGKSVTVALTDRCEACAITDLDFSPTAFNTIADPALGRISGMTWVWV